MLKYQATCELNINITSKINSKSWNKTLEPFSECKRALPFEDLINYFVHLENSNLHSIITIFIKLCLPKELNYQEIKVVEVNSLKSNL